MIQGFEDTANYDIISEILYLCVIFQTSCDTKWLLQSLWNWNLYVTSMSLFGLEVAYCGKTIFMFKYEAFQVLS